MPEWKVVRLEYKNVDNPSQNVLVTNMHWECTASELKDPAPSDPEDDLYWRGRVYGSLPDGNNRVYTLPALQAVPQATVIGWVQAAIDAGPEQSVAEIEAAVLAQIEKQKNPPGGSVVPV